MFTEMSAMFVFSEMNELFGIDNINRSYVINEEMKIWPTPNPFVCFSFDSPNPTEETTRENFEEKM